ncbi:TIGR01906 family membrane protein [Enterococcus pseudoavium]|nr:TIGR01906 family membrane protein [Enterococcus pseudoavium]
MKKIVLYLTIAIFSLSFAITVTINFPGLLKTNLLLQDSSNFERWSIEQVSRDFRNLMDYLNNPFLKSLDFDYLFLSKQGRTHFKDVKKLFQLNYFLLLFSGMSLFLFNTRKIIFREQIEKILKQVKYLFLVIGLGALLFFERAFILFHELLFANNYWIFDYQTDPIILFLPESLFLICFVLIVLISSIFLLILPKFFPRDPRFLNSENFKNSS